MEQVKYREAMTAPDKDPIDDDIDICPDCDGSGES
jgi:hypothetical protein